MVASNFLFLFSVCSIIRIEHPDTIGRKRRFDLNLSESWTWIMFDTYSTICTVVTYKTSHRLK